MRRHQTVWCFPDCCNTKCCPCTLCSQLLGTKLNLIPCVLAIRLHQVLMALLVPDDSLVHFWHIIHILCYAKCDIFQLGWVLPSVIALFHWNSVSSKNNQSKLVARQFHQKYNSGCVIGRLDQNNRKARLFDGMRRQKPRFYNIDLLLGIFCSHWSQIMAWRKALALWLFSWNGQ